MTRLGLTWLCAAFVVLGCSSDSNAPAPMGGAGGAGGSGAGGSGAGGSSGSGATGGASGATGGSAGAGGEGGQAGTATSMMAGQGGSVATGEHCREGASRIIYDDPAASCNDYEIYYSLPNAGAIYPHGFALPSAMVPGEPYTISIDISDSGARDTYELWGTDGQCGTVGELLYWTESAPGILCATFTPTVAHSGLMVVRRTLERADGSSYADTIAFCGAEHACPAGSAGHALAPGVVLEPPVGQYPESSGGPTSTILTRDYFVGVTGRVVLSLPEVNTLGSPIAIKHGLFRMSPSDPFGDGWYCVGEGSTLTLHEDSDVEDLALRNITRATCPAASSGTLAIEPAGEGQMLTGSFAELMASTQLSQYSLSCEWKECRLYYAPSESADVMGTFTLDTNIGTNASTPSGPMPLVTDPVGVVGAFMITAPVDGSAMRYACGTAGTIQLSTGVSAYHVELTDLSAFTGCPGEPIDDDSHDLVLRN